MMKALSSPGKGPPGLRPRYCLMSGIKILAHVPSLVAMASFEPGFRAVPPTSAHEPNLHSTPYFPWGSVSWAWRQLHSFPNPSISPRSRSPLAPGPAERRQARGALMAGSAAGPPALRERAARRLVPPAVGRPWGRGGGLLFLAPAGCRPPHPPPRAGAGGGPSSTPRARRPRTFVDCCPTCPKR